MRLVQIYIQHKQRRFGWEGETFVGGDTVKAAGRAPIDPVDDLTLSRKETVPSS